MADFDDLADLVGATDALETGSSEWATARQEAIRAVRRQVDRCVQWLHPSRFLIAEAIGHSEACGNLVKLAERLDAVAPADAPEYDTDPSTSIPAENIEILNQAYVVYRRSESKFTSYRKATISHRSLGTRIARLARLSHGENARPWQAPFVELIRTADDALPSELERMAQQGRAKELKYIDDALSDLADDDPRVDRALKVIRSVRAEAHGRSSDRRRVRLLEKLHDAHSTLDLERASELLMEIDAISGGSSPTDEQQALIDDVRSWVDHEQNAADTLSKFNSRLEDLERALDENRSRSEMERLHAALLEFDESIPAPMEARFQAQVATAERTERAKRRILATSAVIAIAIGAIIVTFVLIEVRKSKNITTSAREIIALVDAWDLDTAEERLQELQERVGESGNVELGNAVAEVAAARASRIEIDAELQNRITSYQSFASTSSDVDALDDAATDLRTYIVPGASPTLDRDANVLLSDLETTRDRLAAEQRIRNRNEINELEKNLQLIETMWSEVDTSPNLEYRLETYREIEKNNDIVVEGSTRLLDSTSLAALERTRCTEILNDAQLMSSELERGISELEPGVAVLRQIESPSNEDEFATSLDKLVNDHFPLIVSIAPDITRAQWDEAIDAARQGQSILIWRREIMPILDNASGNDLSQLSRKQLENISTKSLDLARESPGGPLRDYLEILTALRPTEMRAEGPKIPVPDLGRAFANQDPASTFVDAIEAAGLTDLIVATVLEGGNQERVLLGYEETSNERKAPFGYWAQRKRDLGAPFSGLAAGKRAVDTRSGSVLYKGERWHPGTWGLSDDIGRGVDWISARSTRIDSQRAALDLLAAIANRKDAAEARFYMLRVMWDAYCDSFTWPSDENERIREELKRVDAKGQQSAHLRLGACLARP